VVKCCTHVCMHVAHSVLGGYVVLRCLQVASVVQCSCCALWYCSGSGLAAAQPGPPCICMHCRQRTRMPVNLCHYNMTLSLALSVPLQLVRTSCATAWASLHMHALQAVELHTCEHVSAQHDTIFGSVEDNDWAHIQLSDLSAPLQWVRTSCGTAWALQRTPRAKARWRWTPTHGPLRCSCAVW
jgi:hypothetical protein